MVAEISLNDENFWLGRISRCMISNRSNEVIIMSTVEEFMAAIESLSQEVYTHSRKWLSEKDWEQWDWEIEEDSDAGRLDFLIDEAMVEKRHNKLKEL